MIKEFFNNILTAIGVTLFLLFIVFGPITSFVLLVILAVVLFR